GAMEPTRPVPADLPVDREALHAPRAVRLAVLVAALGYFVDIYDLLLFSIVRIPSVKALGVNPDDGAWILSAQMVGLLVGGVARELLQAGLAPRAPSPLPRGRARRRADLVRDRPAHFARGQVRQGDGVGAGARPRVRGPVHVLGPRGGRFLVRRAEPAHEEPA